MKSIKTAIFMVQILINLVTYFMLSWTIVWIREIIKTAAGATSYYNIFLAFSVVLLGIFLILVNLLLFRLFNDLIHPILISIRNTVFAHLKLFWVIAAVIAFIDLLTYIVLVDAVPFKEQLSEKNRMILPLAYIGINFIASQYRLVFKRKRT